MKKEPVQRPEITKDTRTLIRLKHSLAAGQEINAVMPDKLEELDDALAHRRFGELKATLDDDIGDA